MDANLLLGCINIFCMAKVCKIYAIDKNDTDIYIKELWSLLALCSPNKLRGL
jgi:hypothetical protein